MGYREAAEWRKSQIFKTKMDVAMDEGLFDSEIRRVSVEKFSLDVECSLDMIEGRGIRLTSVDSFDKKNQKIYTGLQSSFFGTDIGDDQACEEVHSCACKHLIGMAYDGDICPICGTIVEFQDSDLTKTGWIILDRFQIISPIYWAKLCDALGSFEGEKVAERIIKVSYEEDGEIAYNDKELNELKKHPFLKKGMLWLLDNIFEVLDYYAAKKPGKRALFDELRAESGIMSAHSIPVYSAILRTEVPGEKGGKVYKMKINTAFQSIIRIANYINGIEKEDLTDPRIINSIQKQLYAIQIELGNIFNIIFEECTSKNGIIQSKILGGRCNWSARNVITASSGILRADQVELGYVTFMELYRYELINLYTKVNQCTIREASNAWKKGLTHFDKNYYSIIQYMTTDKKCRKRLAILISRNPMIEYLSMLAVYIVHVKPDINDKSMTIPSVICGTTNADFDGDMMNIYRIFGDYFQKKFMKCLNPRYNIYVSRMDGKLNKDAIPFKDENVGFYLFNNV